MPNPNWVPTGKAQTNVAPSPTAPAAVTGLSASYTWINGQLQFVVECAAPTPLSVFKGVHLYIELPDLSGLAAVDLAGTLLDGSATLAGNPKPIDCGTFDAPTGTIAGDLLTLTSPALDAPAELSLAAISARVRVVSYSTQLENSYNSSPSITVAVDPDVPGKPNAADAYVPNALSFEIAEGYPEYEQRASGQFWKIAFNWADNTEDHRYARLSYCNVIFRYSYSDTGGRVRRKDEIVGVRIDHTTGAWLSEWIAVPSAARYYVAFLQAADLDGNENPIISDVTPSVNWIVSEQVGAAGEEYAPVVTHLTASAAYGLNASGQRVLKVSASWRKSIAPSYGGAIIYLVRSGIAYPLTGVVTDVGYISDVYECPDTDEAASLYAISCDTANRPNTYVVGVTPEVSVTLPAVPRGTSNVTGFAVGSPVYALNADGQRSLKYSVSWTNPASDSTFAGIVVYLTIPGGQPQPLTGLTADESVDVYIPHFPTAAEDWDFEAVSVDVNGQANASGPVVTKHVALPSAGCADVTVFTVGTLLYGLTGDGQRVLKVPFSWTVPSDSRYGGVILYLRRPGYASDIPLTGLEPGAAVTSDIPGWPSSSESWLFYALSIDVNNRPNVYSGGTPQSTVTVGPPALGSAGVEYAAVVSSLSVTPSYLTDGSGQVQLALDVIWGTPADVRYGGGQVGYIRGTIFHSLGAIAQSSTRVLIPDFPSVTETWTVFVLSSDRNNNVNAYQPGVTPVASVTVNPPTLTTSDVTSFAVGTQSYGLNADGQRSLIVPFSWTRPSDVTFAGVILFVQRPGYATDVALTGLSTGSDDQSWIPNWPEASESWLFYALSVDVNGRTKAYGVSTPQQTVTVGPPAAGSAGVEYAAVVSSLSVTPSYLTDGSGQQQLVLDIIWGTPADSRYGGAQAGYIRGAIFHSLGAIAQSSIRVPIADFPSASEAWTVFVLSADKNNNVNSYQPGVTPVASVTVAPPALGSSASEYCSGVTIGTVTLSAGLTAPDGTYGQWVTATFTAPADVKWGSVDLVLKDAGGNLVSLETGARSSPVRVWFKPPGVVQTGRFYLVSRDVNGRRNSIVDGTTPSADVSIGATSQLDFTAAKVATLSKQFSVNTSRGFLQIDQVSADLIFAGALQVGGGTLNGVCNVSGTAVTGTSGSGFTLAMVGNEITIGGAKCEVSGFTSSSAITLRTSVGTLTAAAWSYGRPPQMKVYDRSNALIGFWGDDFAITGFVGLWAGRNVRLGGSTIAAPVVSVDSAGAVVIDGATFRLQLNGFTTEVLNATDTNLGIAGVKLTDDSAHNYALLSPGGLNLVNTDAIAVLASVKIAGSGSGASGLLGANSPDGLKTVLMRADNTNGGRILINGQQVLGARGAAVSVPAVTTSQTPNATTYGTNESNMLNALKADVTGLQAALVDVRNRLSLANGGCGIIS